MRAVPLGQLDGLARSASQVIKLGASGLAASDRLDIEYVGRVEREDPFDALAADHPPDSEGLANTPALAGDHGAAEYLRAFLLALFDSAANVNDIAYLEVRNLFLETFAFNCIQYFSFHWSFSYST